VLLALIDSLGCFVCATLPARFGTSTCSVANVGQNKKSSKSDRRSRNRKLTRSRLGARTDNAAGGRLSICCPIMMAAGSVRAPRCWHSLAPLEEAQRQELLLALEREKMGKRAPSSFLKPRAHLLDSSYNSRLFDITYMYVCFISFKGPTSQSSICHTVCVTKSEPKRELWRSRSIGGASSFRLNSSARRERLLKSYITSNIDDTRQDGLVWQQQQ